MAHVKGPLQVKATMTAIATALEEGGVVTKAWPFPFESAAEGQAVVGYPVIQHDTTMRSGSETADLVVLVLAGVAGKEATLDVIDRLLGRTTGAAVKPTLESGDYGDMEDVMSSLRVKRSEVVPVVLGKVRYAATRHECEVIS